MDNEKDLLRKDLENQNTPEEIKKFVEDAELLGHEDIALLGKQKLEVIEAKAGEISKTSESQVSQVNELGGSSAEIDKRTEEVDQKIEEVQKSAENQIVEIQNKNQEKKEINRESIKIGSVFKVEFSRGKLTEVKVLTEIRKTNDVNPREYVRVKAVNGTLETDIEIEKLIDADLEKQILKQKISDIQRSLDNNLKIKESLASLGNKKVASAEHLVSSLGVPLMFLEETNKLRDLIRKRNLYPRGSIERDNAQKDLIQFQKENTGDSTTFLFYPSPEDSYVLVKGINGPKLMASYSLDDAIGEIIINQKKDILDLEEKIQ